MSRSEAEPVIVVQRARECRGARARREADSRRKGLRGEDREDREGRRGGRGSMFGGGDWVWVEGTVAGVDGMLEFG